jgi:hypothetical protein
VKDVFRSTIFGEQGSRQIVCISLPYCPEKRARRECDSGIGKPEIINKGLS